MNSREDQKRNVQQSTDIVRLIGEQVSLRPRGKEFIGVCPFHDDKNPSMYVSPVKQIYKCFSCGAGGDVFTFAMEYHKMTFPEAMKFLAERAGIKLETFHKHGEGESQEGSGPSERQLMADANVKAVNFFQAIYRHKEHGQIAREYVEGRHISAEMIEQFQLGYAPDRWDGLFLMVQDKGWNLRAFEMAGLVSPRQNGPGHYDRLRHRIIFPICDALGRPIAFGGRKIRAEDEPKYLNSPETALFNKSATLYGLHLAKKAIIDSRTAVIVEGYTDVIACHQAGVRNVVATLGTALTSQHVKELRRYCEKVVLIYDADEAGIKAADRAVEIFLLEDMDVVVASLPDELDPAELFEQPDGINRWTQSIATAKGALETLLVRLESDIGQTESVTGMQKLLHSFIDRLMDLGFDRMLGERRTFVIPRLAQMLKMSERQLLTIINDAKNRRRGVHEMKRGIPIVNAEIVQRNHAMMNMFLTDTPLELAVGNKFSKAKKMAHKYLLGCLMVEPQLFALHNVEEELPTEDMWGDEKVLYCEIYAKLSRSETLTFQSFLADLAERGQHDLANKLTTCEEFVQLDIEASTTGIEPLFESYLRAIRLFREAEVYYARKASFENKLYSNETSDKDVQEFLELMTLYLREHPNVNQIFGSNEDKKVESFVEEFVSRKAS